MYRYLVLCVGLAACVSAGGEIAATATGVTGTYSSQIVISDHPHHVLIGHVVQVEDGGQSAVALVISHRRDGVHRLRFTAARQRGRDLPYRRLNRRLGCTHGACLNDAVGLITLGPLMLNRAARDGFDAVLIGPEGTIPIHVPPALFQAVALDAD